MWLSATADPAWLGQEECEKLPEAFVETIHGVCEIKGRSSVRGVLACRNGKAPYPLSAIAKIMLSKN